MKKVAIVMGSKSDLSFVQGAYQLLKEFDIETSMRVLSAHRTPKEASDFAKNAKQNGFGVIICAAGGAAHLAGVMASLCELPVVGIPIKSSFQDGLDSLLSTVQMPSGVPVATVGVNNSVNAALLAVQILSLSDESLAEKFAQYKAGMAKKVLSDDAEIQKIEF